MKKAIGHILTAAMALVVIAGAWAFIVLSFALNV